MGALGVFAVVAGLATVAGGTMTLLISRERMAEVAALGAGLLLGSALLSMLPEALREGGPRAPLMVAVGYFGMYLLRHVWRPNKEGVHMGSAIAATAGLLLHSLFDGAAMTIAMYADPRLGLATFLAIALHKLPEGFSIASIVLAATDSPRAAIAATGAVGLATLTGAWLPVLWQQGGLVPPQTLLGLAAGSFLYVGASDLVPAFGARGGRSAWLVLVGAALIFLLIRSGGVAHSH